MQVNVEKLKSKIKRCGYTQECFAKLIYIDKSTLSRKFLSNGVSFTIGEMHDIVKILKLTKAEACEIFLAQ